MSRFKLVVYISPELTQFFDDIIYKEFKASGKVPIKKDLTKARNLMVVELLEKYKTDNEIVNE